MEIKEIKNIEKTLTGTYAKIKKDIPNMYRLTFEIDEYEHKKGVFMHGFYHIEGECYQYASLAKLYNYIAKLKADRVKNEILFRKF